MEKLLERSCEYEYNDDFGDDFKDEMQEIMEAVKNIQDEQKGNTILKRIIHNSSVLDAVAFV